ncbi:hypothetical protein [Chitinimonas lacunae]|uniref:Uncharacterized protein n=1 Tax=Chitinimonas lacunae TaxID=1963018 RepID=A0ABV8MSZ4_9NEIS
MLIPLVREKDDLDWFNAVDFKVESVGNVVAIRYDNIPGRAAIYLMAARCNVQDAQTAVMKFLGLKEENIEWKRPLDI